jgi:hypothetical protein
MVGGVVSGLSISALQVLDDGGGISFQPLCRVLAAGLPAVRRLPQFVRRTAQFVRHALEHFRIVMAEPWHSATLVLLFDSRLRLCAFPDPFLVATSRRFLDIS